MPYDNDFNAVYQAIAFSMKHLDDAIMDPATKLGMKQEKQEGIDDLLVLLARSMNCVAKHTEIAAPALALLEKYLAGNRSMRTRRARKVSTCTSAHMSIMDQAFVECNPGLLSLDMMARVLRAPGKIVRSPPLIGESLGSYPEPTNVRRSFTEPRDPETRTYYYQQAAAQDRSENRLKPAYRHVQSPLYMFHAWAWGRRKYADILDLHELKRCPYTGLEIGMLRNENPADQLIWLHPHVSPIDPNVRFLIDDLPGIRLAIGWLAEKLNRGLSDRLRPGIDGTQYLPRSGSIGPTALYIPWYGKRAHLIPEFKNEVLDTATKRGRGRPFSTKPTEVGTSTDMLRRFILRALRGCGVVDEKKYMYDVIETHKIQPDTMYHRTIRPQHTTRKPQWTYPVSFAEPYDSESDMHSGATVEAATTDDAWAAELAEGLKDIPMRPLTEPSVKLDLSDLDLDEPSPPTEADYEIALQATLAKANRMRAVLHGLSIPEDKLPLLQARIDQQVAELWRQFEGEWIEVG